MKKRHWGSWSRAIIFSRSSRIPWHASSRETFLLSFTSVLAINNSWNIE
jgi:hypothetical protein